MGRPIADNPPRLHRCQRRHDAALITGSRSARTNARRHQLEFGSQQPPSAHSPLPRADHTIQPGRLGKGGQADHLFCRRHIQTQGAMSDCSMLVSTVTPMSRGALSPYGSNASLAARIMRSPPLAWTFHHPDAQLRTGRHRRRRCWECREISDPGRRRTPWHQLTNELGTKQGKHLLAYFEAALGRWICSMKAKASASVLIIQRDQYFGVLHVTSYGLLCHSQAQQSRARLHAGI